ncbi:hypothetical protein PtA15_14A283 [Puccinia triticina]|uniref:Uncharacterized protein n=1 Tax=Puccinia triticina TaxID=208348 RepID=A0ABY7D1F1_9BASI|nr:uncharacterized protein PtA15_14A283 [Puccinia triticina]WAQ91399.1 hypothetical protein PtA15_14A283 [Puccinia triticina]
MHSRSREATLIPDIKAYTRDNRERSVFRLVMATPCPPTYPLPAGVCRRPPLLADINRADCVCPTAKQVAALAVDMADA